MILKGNQRAGGQQLAAHLMNAFDNERVEIADMRGAVARDLSGAFAEWTAQARTRTKLKKEFYSLSLSPDPKQGTLTRAQYLDLLDRTERSLKLVGQPRAVVFHTKDGREHCHAVWSRADMERKKGVDIAHDRLKLRSVARAFCRDHGLELPERMKPGKNRDKFKNNAKEDLGERQQKERTGISKQQRMADIATCWKESGNGTAFVQALEKKGYFIARGDQKAFVVVDLHGEVHSLSRQLSGIAKSADLRARMSGYPLDKLPGVDAAQAWAKKQREQYEKQNDARQPSEVEKRRVQLLETQRIRRDDLDRRQVTLFARHLSEREGLRAVQEAEKAGVVTARLAKQPKGVLAFLTRITGIQTIIGRRHEKQDRVRAQEHKIQTDSLQKRHARELHEATRRSRALSRLEARENKSVVTALKREMFQQILERAMQAKKPPARVLKPEFDRAAQQIQARTGTDDGRGLQKGELIEAFTPPAKPPVDLVQEFNRQVKNRTSREDNDRDPDGPDRGFDPRRR